MSTATKHMKRSHRSERKHLAALHQMKQFTPPIGTSGPLPYAAIRQPTGAHALGRKNGLIQRLKKKLASDRGQ